MPKTPFIPSLTPLRGIAAILVVYFHFNALFGPLASKNVFIISKMYLMVDLFFVLSGFIMVHVYGRHFTAKVSGSKFMEFMKARFARLYPLHLFTFAYIFFLILYVKSQIDFSQTPQTLQGFVDNSAIPFVLTLTHAWGTHIEGTWNVASWSISVEWFLYLLFPLIIWGVAKNKRLLLPLLGLLSLAALFYICYYIEPKWILRVLEYRNAGPEMIERRPENALDIITGFALLRGLAGFIFGIIAYELYSRDFGRQYLKSSYYYIFICVSLCALWYKNLLPDPFAVAIFGLLILQTAYVEGFIKTILNSKILTYLGDISYSIYMVHVPVMMTIWLTSLLAGNVPDPNADINYAGNWIFASIIVLVVIGLASLSYFFIEKPARRKVRKLLSKKTV